MFLRRFWPENDLNKIISIIREMHHGSRNGQMQRRKVSHAAAAFGFYTFGRQHLCLVHPSKNYVFFCCFVIPMFHCLPAQFCADTLTNRSSRTRMQSGVDFFPDNYRKIFWKKYFWMLLDWLLILEKRVSQKCLQYFRNNFRRNNLQINSHRNARHFPTIRMHHIFHVASALHQTRALVAHFLLL